MCLAVPGEVLEVFEGSSELERRARVRFGGVVREVSLACVPQAAVGEFVLVHVGLAIARIDAAEAARVFETLAELGELDATQPEAPGP
ncbi:MAG: HypC/HybG/HupF family hydrogenase formation chaperone [Planctomycetes bacterium]|nr:HypC/HybG/HupF family hydrogenase formation chaperone [Planctomycetota bacterium]